MEDDFVAVARLKIQRLHRKGRRPMREDSLLGVQEVPGSNPGGPT